jgi:hypothetical protein
MADDTLWLALTLMRVDDPDLESAVMLIEWTPAQRQRLWHIKALYRELEDQVVLHPHLGDTILHTLELSCPPPRCYLSLPIGETEEESLEWADRLDRGYPDGELYTGLRPDAGRQEWRVTGARLHVDDVGVYWTLTQEVGEHWRYDWTSNWFSWARIEGEMVLVDIAKERMVWEERGIEP